MMIPAVIKVYLSDESTSAVDVPITPNTTALDVVQYCREPGETACHLAELWRGNEREVSEGEKPYTILQQWGSYAPEVQFYLRHFAGSAGTLLDRPGNWNEDHSMLNSNQPDLSLAELKEMAQQQQVLIEQQQQMLVGKEQRLRFLRQQAQQQQSLLGENDRLKRLREKAQAQEDKLKKIRAMRGKLDQRRNENSTLSVELEAVRALFEEKQNELTAAITKVDDLTKKLEEVKNNKIGPTAQSGSENFNVNNVTVNGTSTSELDKLRMQLTNLNQRNEDRQRNLNDKRSSLKKRNEEARELDRRIDDLTDRLKKRRAAAGLSEEHYSVNEQSKIPSYPPPAPPMHTIVAAVEPLKQNTGQAREEHDALVMKQRPGEMYRVPPDGVNRPGYLPRQNTYGSPNTPTSQKPTIAKSASSDNLPIGNNFAANRAAFEQNSRMQPVPRSPSAASQLFPGPKDSLTATVRPMPPNSSSQGPTGNHPGGINLFAYKQPPVVKNLHLPPNATMLPDGNIRYTQPPAGHPPPPYPNGPRLSDSSDGHVPISVEAIRRKFAHAPRPLKKRNSITDAERQQGPNIPKSLYEHIYKQADTPFYRPSGDESPAIPITRHNEPPPAYAPPIEPPKPKPPSTPIAPEDTTGSNEPNTSMSTNRNLDKITAAFNRMTKQQEHQPAADDRYHRDSPHNNNNDFETSSDISSSAGPFIVVPQLPFDKVPTKSNLKKPGSVSKGIRIRFDPLALLLDASLEGEFDLVKEIIDRVLDPSGANDEGITALHNAVCAGHTELVRFLVHYGSDINAADTDGWTPLHCAASCNNLSMAKFLVENGACIFATTISDGETAADKCEELDEGYLPCFDYLSGIQEKFGLVNKGQVFALFDYEATVDDELSFRDGDIMTILRRGDENETEWWWARKQDREGYIARNLLGMWPRIKPHRE